MAVKRILIVEDDLGTLTLLKLYFEKRGYVVDGAESGEQALEIVENQLLDLIILDIEIPGMNGFEVCKKVRHYLDIPILFISSRRSIMDKLKCFELGGDDYITKPFVFRELAARVQANLRRYQESVKQQSTTKRTCGVIDIHLETYQCFKNGEEINLTAKEKELLILLATEPSKVFSVEELYDRIWGYDSIGNPETVKSHIKNLRQKVETVPTNPQHIITVRGFGYQLIC